MMPRPSPENLDNNGFAQTYGGARNQAAFQMNQGFAQGGDSEFRQRFAQGQMNQGMGMPMQMSMAQMQMEQQPMLQNQAMGGYRHDLARNSPSMQAMAASTYGMLPDMSPNVARMQIGSNLYGSLSATQTPTSPAAFHDMDVRGLQAAASAGAGGQAEREEELLLNLLIARRQRNRVPDSKSSGRNPTLAEELMRMRQQTRMMPSQQQQQQQGRSLPPMPGMPPLFQSEAGFPSVSGLSAAGGVLPPDFRKASDVMNLSVLQSQEAHERIDRSPTRMMQMDARSQDMLEYSGRGVKRGHPAFDAMSKFHVSMGMSDMEMSPGKKKRKHKKKPVDMPRRPLSAYNLFFSEERERILKEIDGKEGDDKDDDEGEEDSKKDGDESESGVSPKPKALMRPLIPAQKKRRPHRKTHGKISFQELARLVGERWKNLSDERRQYYQDLAKDDMKRQKAAMEEYYAKQNVSKPKSVEKTEESKSLTGET